MASMRWLSAKIWGTGLPWRVSVVRSLWRELWISTPWGALVIPFGPRRDR
jgi:hypothetical protein